MTHFTWAHRNGRGQTWYWYCFKEGGFDNSTWKVGTGKWGK